MRAARLQRREQLRLVRVNRLIALGCVRFTSLGRLFKGLLQIVALDASRCER